YFSLYMLRDLGLDYDEYALITAAAMLGQFFVFSRWGELADLFGSKKVLTVCGFGVAVVPFLWLVDGGVWYLVVIQLLSGLSWAGYNLATATFLFDAVTPGKRARCSAYQTMCVSIFVLVGSLVGSGIISLGAGHPLPLLSGAAHSKYLVVFLCSGLFRLVVAVVSVAFFREVRAVHQIRHRDLIFRVAHVRGLAELRLRAIPTVEPSATDESGKTDSNSLRD
ncbi:MAG: MFS transporter, partial [Bdellovibrionales bacterium]|nr:MFS transporter [Bdellovibrionales bacterium]